MVAVMPVSRLYIGKINGMRVWVYRKDCVLIQWYGLPKLILEDFAIVLCK